VNLNDHDELMEALRELDTTPEEVSTWAPIVQRLATWSDPQVTAADQLRLLAVLGEPLARRSPVRQAVREHLAHRNRLAALLTTVHSQVSVLRPSFWVLSGMLILLGVAIELVPAQNGFSLFWLRALAPLLAYLSFASMFRSAGLRTLECELACPPSMLQLIIARLVIVLSYDIALGMLLSLVGWTQGEGGFLLITLHWLVPLLLITGLALVLSLRLSIPFAVGLPYCGWLALLVLGASHLQSVLSVQSELLLGLAGVALLALALWRFTQQLPRHFLSAAT
jgi:hypothetical protein